MLLHEALKEPDSVAIAHVKGDLSERPIKAIARRINRCDNASTTWAYTDGEKEPISEIPYIIRFGSESSIWYYNQLLNWQKADSHGKALS